MTYPHPGTEASEAEALQDQLLETVARTISDGDEDLAHLRSDLLAVSNRVTDDVVSIRMSPDDSNLLAAAATFCLIQMESGSPEFEFPLPQANNPRGNETND